MKHRHLALKIEASLMATQITVESWASLDHHGSSTLGCRGHTAKETNHPLPFSTTEPSEQGRVMPAPAALPHLCLSLPKSKQKQKYQEKGMAIIGCVLNSSIWIKGQVGVDTDSTCNPCIV